MAPNDFVHALERELRLWNMPFRHSEVIVFVACSWTPIEDDPDPKRWAGEFLEAKILTSTDAGRLRRAQEPSVVRLESRCRP
jgi:hypothetical protein